MISGTDIKAVRVRLAESQTDFAKRIGVDQTTLSRWETGEVVPRGPARLFLERVLADLGREAAE